MPKKHIALIMPLSTYDWGNNNCGGVDSVCQMFAEYLVNHDDANFRFTIIGLDPQSKTPFSGDVIRLSDNVDFVWLPASSKQSKFKIPGIIWQNWHIRKLLKILNPDLVHTHFWSVLIGSGFRGKSVVTVHSYKKIGRHNFGFFNNFLYEKIIPKFTRHLGDKKFVVGDILKQELAKNNIKANIIYNPIDDSFFNSSKQSQLIELPQEIKFITCALINPKKNIEQSIDIVHMLNQNGIACRLDIVGSKSNKEYAQQLERKIEALQLESSVAFLGRKNKYELIELYNNANCGIFTSKEETFGLVPLEILATGLPLLCTEVGILAEQKEFFQSIGVLYITESTTVDEITANLNNFDRELSVKKLKELFNTSQIIKQYKAVYNELVFKAEREQ
ncbi:Glycosyltransferase involved in cell wall bisynthesis [Pseudoalteromonas sp. DSM 26666]|uniref:VpsD family glycosyltransferase n=1 Tax=Pseudoalteromonas sp. DSM 26666 TaxID=1761892 RepID=UPI0008EF6406|nr:VpsD family glycosyltransferase [Pseudoalteromonas sp. DSM 26666]SFT48412.1 Glycosyltransferase involved in cell wall bisynthesis [Pseudoalteromonas sp. DSM 26666]